MELLPVILLPFAGAAVAAAGGARFGGRGAAWAAGITTVLAGTIFLAALPPVAAGGAVRTAWPWLPELGLFLSLRLDGLSALFVGLILGIGLLIVVYARSYLGPKEAHGRFHACLLLFMGSMLGVVTADNLIVLLVFWELTSLSSFLLIGFWHGRAGARRGARMALVITGGGGLALLAGVLLLGEVAGSYEISALLAEGERIREHAWYPLILVLIVVGALAKSAQFPLHFWLPHAMTAPTPVSAYLHSATMVKAGVFLMARLHPVLSGTDLWCWLVGGVGLATLLFGAVVALFQDDLKSLLAYSTVSHLGLITFLLGLGTDAGAVAAVFHIINHATFKASLFMVAGIIEHETGTRDLRRLSDLWRWMPWTGTLAMVAAASMAGVPLFNGFLSKEMFLAASLSDQVPLAAGSLLPVLAVAAATFSVAYSLRFIHGVFFGDPPTDLPRTPGRPPRLMRIPVEVLALLCLAIGLFPGLVIQGTVDVVAAAVLQGEPPAERIAIWHGITAPLLMSLAALGGGVLVHALRRPLGRVHDRWIRPVDARTIFEAAVAAAIRSAGRVTGWLESGSLPVYGRILVGVTLAAALGGWVGTTALPVAPVGGEAIEPVSAAAFVLLGAAALGATVWHRQRLLAVILVGGVGLVVTLTFARLSAPDLALTQLSVEVVSVVLLLLALHFLPQTALAEDDRRRRLGDALLAGAFGIGTALLVREMLRRPHESISEYFLDTALPGGGGTNVVNVILVDFRGFDTWGEISVLAIAAVAVFSIMRSLTLWEPAPDDGRLPWAGGTHPLFLRMIARPLLPLALLVSLYILLRGHNLPGGGFVAGLVTAVALVLQYIAEGFAWMSRRGPRDHHPVIAAGLLCATLTGLGAWAFGFPFLTSSHGRLALPLVGELELATAMLFDVGVYLTVVGSVMLILVCLGVRTEGARPLPGSGGEAP